MGIRKLILEQLLSNIKDIVPREEEKLATYANEFSVLHGKRFFKLILEFAWIPICQIFL